MFCTKCGTEVKEGSIFCSACGTKIEVIPTAQNFVEQVPIQAEFPNVEEKQIQNEMPIVEVQTAPENYSPTQVSSNPVYESAAYKEAAKPKRFKWWLIPIIAGGATTMLIVLLVIIGVIVGDSSSSNNQSYNYNNDYTWLDDDDLSSYITETEPVEYTKGSVVDGWYINEWANIKFNTNGWETGTESMYAFLELYEEMDGGLILRDEATNDVILLVFEKLPDDKEITIDEYLNVTTKGLKTNSGVESIKDEECIIANKKFKGKKAVGTNSQGDSQVQGQYVYFKDGYAIVIIAQTGNENDLLKILNSFQPVN